MKKVTYKSPDELKLLTNKTWQETSTFIKKLKKKKPKNLDDVVHELHAEAFSTFNCLGCANCCKTIGPRLIDKDIERLAKHLKMKVSDFAAAYISTDAKTAILFFKEHPVHFYCQIIIVWFMNADPGHAANIRIPTASVFTRILPLSHKNCETCPVVYDIFDELKLKNL